MRSDLNVHAGRPSLSMTSLSQARRLLRNTAFSAAILLTAAPAALADPQGYQSMGVQPTAPATVETPSPELQNAPAPGPEFLSSPEAWETLSWPRTRPHRSRSGRSQAQRSQTRTGTRVW